MAAWRFDTEHFTFDNADNHTWDGYHNHSSPPSGGGGGSFGGDRGREIGKRIRKEDDVLMKFIMAFLRKHG